MNENYLLQLMWQILSGQNREGRRKWYKKNYKKLGLASWEEVNADPRVVKREPVISSKNKSRMGWRRRNAQI